MSSCPARSGRRPVRVQPSHGHGSEVQLVDDRAARRARSNSCTGAGGISRIIVRPISNNTARLQALQTGEINGYDLVAPQDMPTIRSNSRLRLINRPPFNVAYVTINRSKAPMNNLLVAGGGARLDRAGVVKSFYAGRAVVAHQFMPPAVPGYEPTVKKYPFNPERSKQLLRQAGLSLPVKIDFYWPTNVSRPYMPSPNLNFQAFKASLNVRLRGERRERAWRPDYVKHVNEGSGGHLNLIGWTGDYATPTTSSGRSSRARTRSSGSRGGRARRDREAARPCRGRGQRGEAREAVQADQQADRELHPGRSVRPFDAGRRCSAAGPATRPAL